MVGWVEYRTICTTLSEIKALFPGLTECILGTGCKIYPMK